MITAPASVPTAKMDGQHVILIEKTDFSFTATQTIWITKYVDTLSWVSGTVIVRVHAMALTSGSTLAVAMRNVSYAPDEPNTNFAAASALASAALNGNAAPVLVAAALTGGGGPIGRYLRAELQFGLGSAGTSTVTLAVELIGRDA